MWSGHSGAASCRLTDISEGGCFVETRAMPVIGETVTVQPTLPGDAPAMRLKGEVIYAIPNIGFAVQFSFDPEMLSKIRQALDDAVDYK